MIPISWVHQQNNQPVQGTKIQHDLDCGLLKSETRDQANEGTLHRREDNACINSVHPIMVQGCGAIGMLMLWDTSPEAEGTMGKLVNVAADALKVVKVPKVGAMMEARKGHDGFS